MALSDAVMLTPQQGAGALGVAAGVVLLAAGWATPSTGAARAR